MFGIASRRLFINSRIKLGFFFLLPVYDIESEIVARVTASRPLVFSSREALGKSTQVPQMLLKHGLPGKRMVSVQNVAVLYTAANLS